MLRWRARERIASRATPGGALRTQVRLDGTCPAVRPRASGVCDAVAGELIWCLVMRMILRGFLRGGSPALHQHARLWRRAANRDIDSANGF